MFQVIHTFFHILHPYHRPQRSPTMTQIVPVTDFPDTSARYPSLAGRRVFITGGGSGIGASLVEGFARQGAHVAFIDTARTGSEQLSRALVAKGLGAPWYRHCDVSDV